MKDRAYAKINLALNVKGRYENGYHALEMIMVPIDFYDVVELLPAPEMSYHCNRSFIYFNEKNTLVKMMNYLKNTYHCQQNFRITLQKHIPTRAGLAGGSADAAALLRLFERWRKAPLPDEERRKAALHVGADVPFCFYNRPALVKGIGEELEFFSLNTDFSLLLAKPKKGISTKQAFAQLRLDACAHPDVTALRQALLQGDYTEALRHMQNSLEEPSFRLLPEISTLKQRFLAAGMDAAVMSGSGSTVLGITRNRHFEAPLLNELKKQGYFVRKTHMIDCSIPRNSTEKRVK